MILDLPHTLSTVPNLLAGLLVAAALATDTYLVLRHWRRA